MANILKEIMNKYTPLDYKNAILSEFLLQNAPLLEIIRTLFQVQKE
jgi:hypothetical protein